MKKENCLNKAGKSCSKCVDRCVNGVFTVDSFDRFECYDLLTENDKSHSDLLLTDENNNLLELLEDNNVKIKRGDIN